MTSRKGGGNNTFMGDAGAGSYSPKGKKIEGSTSGPNIEQLSRDMADVNVDPTQEDGWEVIGKKSKNRSGAAAGAGKILGSSTPAPKAWGQSGGLPRQGWGTNGGAGRASGHSAQAADFRRPAGRGYSKPQPAPRTRESAYTAPKRPGPAVAPPLQDGWQWGARSGSSGSQAKDDVNNSNLPQDGSVDGYDSESDMARNHPDDDNSDDEELPEDTDDDLSDDYDSDVSQKSHETRKKSKLFKGFFEALDKLTVDEINEPTRQWHCPACQNGPGAIDWYTGLQPLITHAKTKGAKRAMIHRGLAKLLDEELRRRGSSVIPPGEAFGKWRGLLETTTDREIVWPPVVVVMNTRLEQDENDKVRLLITVLFLIDTSSNGLGSCSFTDSPYVLAILLVCMLELHCCKWKVQGYRHL